MCHWYVIKTKPKKEKQVFQQLTQAHYELFLPCIEGIRVPIPLFPSYVFIQTDFENPSHYQLVRYTRGVSHILGDREKPISVSKIIVEALKEKTQDGCILDQNLIFKEGDEVTVKKGILKDLRGIIKKKLPATSRVRVLFKWLSGTIQADFKYADLEKEGYRL